MLCPLQRKAETVQGKIPDTGIHIESLCAAVFGAKPWHHLGEGPRTAGDVDTVPIYNLALEFISQFQIPGSIEIAIGILPGQVVVHVVANIGDALEAAISIWFHELVCSATLRSTQILNISAHRKWGKSGAVVTN